MYPASDWSPLLRATVDISACAIFLPDRPRRGPLGSPVFAGAGKTDLHLSVPLADLGGFLCHFMAQFLCSCREPLLRPGLPIL